MAVRTGTVAAPAAKGTKADESSPRPADVLVVFGITGDLAKVMTFRSLYRLDARGLLDCPIVGVAVDDWTDDQLRKRARESIEGTGEKLDKKVFDRFASRLSYVTGDFAEASTYERVGDAIDGASTPVFYLEIPPFLFGAVVKGLSEAGLTKTGRVVVEKPFGHDRESADALADELHQYIDNPSSIASTTTSERWASRRSSISGSQTRCSSRSGAATTSSRCRSPWPRASASRTAATSTIPSARSATSWSIT
jgi:Glucose-6-phosphate dehydrogenase, NAD binding domain